MTAGPDDRAPAPDSAADLTLVREALRGSAPAIDAFLVRMGCVPRILAAKNADFGRPLSALELEDLTQDVLMAIWRKLPAFDGSARLETWVFRFCFLELLKRLRGKRNRPEVAHYAEEIAAVVTDPALDVEKVHLALERIPEEEAKILRLKHFEELTFKAIGALLGIPENTAKSRYYRGIRELRDVLRETTGMLDARRSP